MKINLMSTAARTHTASVTHAGPAHPSALLLEFPHSSMFTATKCRTATAKLLPGVFIKHLDLPPEAVQLPLLLQCLQQQEYFYGYMTRPLLPATILRMVYYTISNSTQGAGSGSSSLFSALLMILTTFFAIQF